MASEELGLERFQDVYTSIMQQPFEVRTFFIRSKLVEWAGRAARRANDASVAPVSRTDIINFSIKVAGHRQIGMYTGLQVMYANLSRPASGAEEVYELPAFTPQFERKRDDVPVTVQLDHPAARLLDWAQETRELGPEVVVHDGLRALGLTAVLPAGVKLCAVEGMRVLPFPVDILPDLPPLPETF